MTVWIFCSNVRWYCYSFPTSIGFKIDSYLVLVCMFNLFFIFSNPFNINKQPFSSALQGICKVSVNRTCWLCAGQLAWPITWQEKQLKQIICLHKRQRTFELFRDLSRRVSLSHSVCWPVSQTYGLSACQLGYRHPVACLNFWMGVYVFIATCASH